MEAPTIDYTFQGNTYTTRDTVFITSKTKISLSANDKNSGVKKIGYKVNGGRGQDYTAPFNLEDEGGYTVDFYGTDEVNNRNSDEFYFIVDNSGPNIENILSTEPIGSLSLTDRDSPLNVYPKGVNLYLGATDEVINVKAIYYQVNGGKEALYTKPIVINQPGNVTYRIRAVDHLGNERISEEFEIFVK